MEFVKRWEELKLHNDTSNKLIEELMWYCKNVEERYTEENARLACDLRDANLDLEDSRRSRRQLQQQLDIAQKSLQKYEIDHDALKARNPYILVLIDGDGLIFKEDLIRAGLDGGKRAANVLRNAVLEQFPDLTDETEVIARVCANVNGLARAMKRDGCLDNMDDLREFALGFTQGKASFDFIDVGHGKERADSKIKESARWNLRNHNCKHILLGVSHDAGYAPFLDEVLGDDTITKRVTIVEGPPLVRELVRPGVRVIKFEDLFRTEKLLERYIIPPTLPAAVPSTGTWAGITSVTPPLAAAMPLAVKNGNTIVKNGTITTKNTSWNPGPRGVDEPITVNAIVLERVKRRTGSNKLCNNHYLRGPCAKGADCTFEHYEDVSDEELKAIAYLTRLNPCTSGQDCELDYCIYGHHCPTTIKGVCQQFGCRFSQDEHPPGTVIKNPRRGLYKEDY